MTTSVLTVRLPDKVRLDLEKIADATNRTKSYIVNKAIEDYVARNAWQIAELGDAVRAADLGSFMSEQAVDDWLASWGADTELPAPEADVEPGDKQ